MKTIHCPHCANPIGDDGSMAGMVVACPGCRREFTMPWDATTFSARAASPKRRRRGSNAPLVVGAGIVLAFCAAVAMALNKSSGGAAVALLIPAALVYFLPTMVGHAKRNAPAIFCLNLFLGWTFLGWVVAMVWAVSKDSRG